MRSATADDVAVMLAYASKVVVVPGYGMVVAQAQHDVRALADILEERGVEVTYAIPGRRPDAGAHERARSRRRTCRTRS